MVVITSPPWGNRNKPPRRASRRCTDGGGIAARGVGDRTPERNRRGDSPRPRGPPDGHIGDVSSVAGRVSVPLIGAYCASKFALEAFSDAVRVECRPFGVKVVVVEPGSTHPRVRERALRARQ